MQAITGPSRSVALPDGGPETGWQPVDETAPAWRSLSIFFPMFNERDSIAATLTQALVVVPRLGFGDWEILVVDDGSDDGSAEVVQEFTRRDSRVRLVQHPCNLGYGAALRTGFTAARGDIVFYTDSDLPIDLGEVEHVLPCLGQADLIIGYRKHRYDTPRRAIYSRVYNLLMRLLFGVCVRDVNFSFKFVHRSALEEFRLNAATVFIDGQILAEAHRLGLRIIEVPVDYRPRTSGASNFNSVRTAWMTLVEMLRYRFVSGSPRKSHG